MGGIDYLRLDKTKDKAYFFDHAFADISQEDVYGMHRQARRFRRARQECLLLRVRRDGSADVPDTGSQDRPGLMPRAIDELFSRAAGDDRLKWRS